MRGYKIFFKSVLSAFYADKKDFIISLFTTIFSASWSFLTFGSFALIVNEVSEGLTTGYFDKNAINIGILVLVLANLIPSLSDLFDQYIGAKLFRNIHLFLNNNWLNKVSSLDLATIESKEFQDLNQKISERSIGSIRSLSGWFFTNFGHIIRLVLSSFVFLKFDPKIIILAVVSAIPAFFIERSLAKKTFELWDSQVENNRKANWKTSHFLNSKLLTELKLLGRSLLYSKKIYSIRKSFDIDANKLDYRTFKLKILGEIVYFTCLIIAIFLIIQMTINGEVLIGTMFFIYSSFQSFQYGSGEIMRSLGRIREHVKFAEGFFELLKLKPAIEETAGADFSSDNIDIKIKDLSFKYPGTDKLVLKNINLEIKDGERIAIVGENGASKTTLIKLISKVYLPTKGEVLVNNQNLEDIKTTDWQRHLSFMTQDYAVYSDSIRDQIAFGSNKNPEEVSFAEIKKSAEKAHATEFIEDLPHKFDSIPVRSFEKGVELSRGQNQKIALARFLLRDAKVLILDEPTSTIDAIAESKIFNELFEEERDRTIIIISHRFNTVKRADRIIVLDHGEIVEEGSHDELIKKNGKYHEMYMAQAKEYQD